MKGYLIFIFIMAVTYFTAEYTRKKGFDNLIVKRYCDNNMIFPGEEFKIVTQIENKKWFPISFLNMQEEYPSKVERVGYNRHVVSNETNYYISSYSILWYERIKRYHTSVIRERGVYYIRNIIITIGDVFGFSSLSENREDPLEIVVYPNFVPMKKLVFQNNSIQGDVIVRRWIFKDTLYVRGIREYNVEDRMKDIHWNSSLRANRLMVKEYDYTSEREIEFIINVQCGRPYWSSIDNKSVERSIKVVMSLASGTIDEGIPTGVMTNAQIISYSGSSPSEIIPGINNFKSILELGARIYKTPRVELYEYLMDKGKSFKQNAIYVLVTSYLDKESIDVLKKLVIAGFTIKIIDTSKDLSLPRIDHIEKIDYKGEVKS